jgi:hypothetical protein
LWWRFSVPQDVPSRCRPRGDRACYRTLYSVSCADPYKRLPSAPTKEDLEAVAAKSLAKRWNAREERWDVDGPAPNRDVIKMVVGYALTCKMRLPAVAATVEEARYQARNAGRPYIVATDLRTALLEYQIPSDEALQQAFESPRECRRPNGGGLTESCLSASNLQRHCNAAATALQ